MCVCCVWCRVQPRCRVCITLYGMLCTYICVLCVCARARPQGIAWDIYWKSLETRSTLSVCPLPAVCGQNMFAFCMDHIIILWTHARDAAAHFAPGCEFIFCRSRAVHAAAPLCAARGSLLIRAKSHSKNIQTYTLKSAIYSRFFLVCGPVGAEW